MAGIIEARFEVLDQRFRSCGGDSRIERLHAGCMSASWPCGGAEGALLAAPFALPRAFRDETGLPPPAYLN